MPTPSVSLMGGFMGGIVAGAADAMAYGTIPDKSPAKKLGASVSPRHEGMRNRIGRHDG